MPAVPSTSRRKLSKFVGQLFVTFPVLCSSTPASYFPRWTSQVKTLNQHVSSERGREQACLILMSQKRKRPSGSLWRSSRPPERIAGQRFPIHVFPGNQRGLKSMDMDRQSKFDARSRSPTGQTGRLENDACRIFCWSVVACGGAWFFCGQIDKGTKVVFDKKSGTHQTGNGAAESSE